MKTPHTKIVVSLGPTLCSESDIRQAMELGADFRQPFGYRLQDHFGQFALLERLRKTTACAAQVYVDLPSERPRVGALQSEFHPQTGQTVRITSQADAAQPGEIPIPSLQRFLHVLEPGHRLLIRDGHTVLRITRSEDRELHAVVEKTVEGIATNNNVMFPDSPVSFEPVVEEDRELLRRYADAGFVPDWAMLSLISSPAQVNAARQALQTIFGACVPKLMVKIETAKSVAAMPELLAACDGLLVGRGDLGIAVPPETIPAIQEDVVRAGLASDKPVLVATEFLHRFAETGVPNRAELSDVALATRQGVSGIVLTKETSSSPFAIESVRLATRIIEVEKHRVIG